MEDQFDGVDAAFEMLLEEIRRSQESLKQAGSKAFADGDLPRVGTIRDKLERLAVCLISLAHCPFAVAGRSLAFKRPGVESHD